MEYKPFEIVIIQELDPAGDEIIKNKYSDDGRMLVKVGDLQIGIKQTEDGQGLIIDCTDNDLCAQNLGEMTVWYDDIIKSEDNA